MGYFFRQLRVAYFKITEKCTSFLIKKSKNILIFTVKKNNIIEITPNGKTPVTSNIVNLRVTLRRWRTIKIIQALVAGARIHRYDRLL